VLFWCGFFAMCSLNIRSLYDLDRNGNGSVSRCPKRLRARRNFPAWCCFGVVSHCAIFPSGSWFPSPTPTLLGIAIPRRSTAFGTTPCPRSSDVVTVVTYKISYSYAEVTTLSPAMPAPRRMTLAATSCDLASILPKVPQTPYEYWLETSRHDGILPRLHKASPAYVSVSPVPFHDPISMKTHTLLCNSS
jgi:hypothetical protein